MPDNNDTQLSGEDDTQPDGKTDGERPTIRWIRIAYKPAPTPPPEP